MSEWHRVENVREFLNRKGTRRVGTHQPKTLKRIPWPYCAKCGLLYLRNEVTRKAIKAPCVTWED